MADIFVIVGRGGRIATSEDGITWTGRTSGTSNHLFPVAVNHNRWLAATFNTQVLRSTSGSSWSISAAPDPDLISFAWNGSFWVSVSASGRIFTSIDGAAWTDRPHGLDPDDIDFEAVAWDAQNGQFVVTGEHLGVGMLMISPDGVTWTQRSVPEGFSPSGVAASNGTIVISSNHNTINSDKVAYSTDSGLSWVTVSTAFTAGSNATRFCVWADSVFIVGGDGSALATSPDGITWTSRTSGFSSGGFIYGAAYGAGKWVIVGRSSNNTSFSYGQIMTSSDLVTWTERVSSTFAAASFQAVQIRGIAFGQSNLAVFADSVIRAEINSSVSLDAELIGPHVRANAVLASTLSQAVTADALVAFEIDDDTTGRNPHDRAEQHFGTMPATAVAYSTTVSLEQQLRYLWDRITGYEAGYAKRGSFTAAALVYKTVVSFFRADSFFFMPSPTGSWVADALLQRVSIHSITADAALLGEGYYITGDGIIFRPNIVGSFTADGRLGEAGAEGESGLPGDHTLAQHLLGGGAPTAPPPAGEGSFTASSVVLAEITGSLTADAVVQMEAASFTGDAVVLGVITSSFTADAVIPGAGGESGLLGDHTLGQHTLGGE